MNFKLLSKRLSLFLFSLFLLNFFANCNAAQSAETQSFLDPASAFRLRVIERPGKIEVHYSIAEGYYLYRERFAFAVKKSNAQSGNATLGAAVLPAGQQKFDRTFQKTVEIYRHHLTVQIPVIEAHAPFDLLMTSQGCADQGICYPPMKQVARISGPALSAPREPKLGKALGENEDIHGVTIHKGYSASYAQSVLQGHGLFAALAIFWGLGVALSLLPCSLPMIPILSAIIIGERKSENSDVPAKPRRRAILLSLMYVLGMSVSYAISGIVAALVGQSLGVWLQNAWVVSVFACFLLIFALSMLGCYRLPILSWQSLNRRQPQQLTRKWQKWLTTFTMGALSALVVGACMTAPLFGVLTFIAQTGDFILGAAALFFIAWGIGTPLLLMGAGVGRWLPRAGAWMEGLERLLGLLLAATALWLVLPILPAPVMMLLCALWLLMVASVLYISTPPLTALGWALVGKSISAMCALFALMLIIGAAAGSHRLLTPLTVFTATATTTKTEAFKAFAEKSSKNSDPQAKASEVKVSNRSDRLDRFSPVKTVEEVRHAINASQKPTLLDFYARWCASCREMEHLTWADPQVRATLSRWNLLRADVTANDANDRALLKYFQLYGPPAVLFFDARGNEIVPLRTVGYQPPEVFLKTLDPDRLRLEDGLDSH